MQDLYSFDVNFEGALTAIESVPLGPKIDIGRLNY
jgi:hypothetical protein